MVNHSYTGAWIDEDRFATYLVDDTKYTLKLKDLDEFHNIDWILSAADLNSGEESVKKRVIDLMGSELARVH